MTTRKLLLLLATGCWLLGTATAQNKVDLSRQSKGILPNAQVPVPGASALGGIKSFDCGLLGAGWTAQKIDTTGTVTCVNGGSAITLNHNGSANTSQAILNLQDGTGTTVSNPSAGNVQVNVVYGSGANTAAAGNDARITGAEQTSNKGANSGYAGLDGAAHQLCTQEPALTGDVTSPAGSCAMTLPNVATAGTGLKTTINAKGQATAVATAATTDLSDNSVIVKNNQSNTFSTGTQDFSAVTMLKARLSAGLTTTVNGDFGFDTTNKNWHFWANGADHINALFSSVPTNGNCVNASVVSSVVFLGDAGAPCGAGGGGANPAGSGSEINARLNGTTFQAVTGSSTSGGNIALGAGNGFFAGNVVVPGFSVVRTDATHLSIGAECAVSGVNCVGAFGPLKRCSFNSGTMPATLTISGGQSVDVRLGVTSACTLQADYNGTLTLSGTNITPTNTASDTDDGSFYLFYIWPTNSVSGQFDAAGTEQRASFNSRPYTFNGGLNKSYNSSTGMTTVSLSTPVSIANGGTGASGTVAAHNYFGNNTGSAANPGFVVPVCADLSNAAASCSTDATNATNIASGTLPAGRLPATVVQTGQTNSYTAGPQDFNAQAATMQAANDTTTGTTVNTLAKLSSTGAINAGTGDTTVPVFVVDSGAGIAGNAKLAIAGQELCKMDATASNTEGFYVVASTTVAKDCHAQSAAPAGVFVVGHMISNSTTSGSTATVAVDPYYAASGGAGTVTTTGSPANGNLAKFSGSTSVTNTDLTGDVTTSGGVATTMKNTGTAGSYAKTTFDAQGRETSGGPLAAADVPIATALAVGGVIPRYKLSVDGSGNLDFDPTDFSIIAAFDDFISGSGATSNQIGKLGWSTATIAGTAPTYVAIAGTYPNMGDLTIKSAATANTGGSMYLGPSGLGSWPSLSAQTNWKVKWRFKLDATTSNQRFYVGFNDVNNAAAPANFCGLRFDSTLSDTAFTVGCDAASTFTVGGTTYAVDTSWHDITISSTVAGTIVFQLDSNSTQSISTNVPNIANNFPIIQIVGTTTTQITIEVDAYGSILKGLSR